MFFVGGWFVRSLFNDKTLGLYCTFVEPKISFNDSLLTHSSLGCCYLDMFANSKKSKLKVSREPKGKFLFSFHFLSSRNEIKLRKFQFFLLRFLERMRLPSNLCPAFRSQPIELNGLTFMSFALDRLLHTTESLECHVLAWEMCVAEVFISKMFRNKANF